MKTEYSKIEPYVTKDGCEIRELMHPNTRGRRPHCIYTIRAKRFITSPEGAVS